ncbi:MAG TPA: hypothetical protein PKD64_17235 [Pirellulaceae bacterium]|mgnify:CR=1 FL=1|nr:hypothetical protein [Pirellulaceae bacterium]HMO93932.1 hypothetical protein [Pirellulaceae bacterium]HMP69757.1 hypothetical protein [Pirellulaceae bacterium]
MSRKKLLETIKRREYDRDFEVEVVEIAIDSLSDRFVTERQDNSNVNPRYRWKQKYLKESGSATKALDPQVDQLVKVP